MNWLDAVLLLLLAWSVVTAFRKGFTREVIGLISVIVGLLAGAWFYGSAAGFLLPYVSSRAVANFAGFMIIFCGVLLLGAIVGLIVRRFLRLTGLSFFDRLLGAGFGLLRGTLIGVALLTGMMAFTPAGRPPDAVVKSRVAPYVMQGSRAVAAVAPHELKRGFRNTYEQVQIAWKAALERADGHGAETKNNEKPN